MEIQPLDFASGGVFEWRWPSGNVESFDQSWTGRVAIGGTGFAFRHGIGQRDVYGRVRVHSVTWLSGAPMIEGVEADDYQTSRALLSLLRRDDKRLARTIADIPTHYEEFLIVNHRDEISAPRSRRSLAVKICEDSVAAWATHAALRAAQLQRLPRF